jgi:polyphosphate kinase 2 (PPK2 family)
VSNLESRSETRRAHLRRPRPWKFSARDVQERQHWDAYQVAFSEMLSHTSTEWAPWHVIPVDRKWFARVAAAAVQIRGAVALRQTPSVASSRPVLTASANAW